MAARTLSDPRDRIVTMLIAPLMTCSARLPVSFSALREGCLFGLADLADPAAFTTCRVALALGAG